MEIKTKLKATAKRILSRVGIMDRRIGSVGEGLRRRRMRTAGDRGNLFSDDLYCCIFCGEAHRNGTTWSPEGVDCPCCGAIGREKFEYYCLLQEVSQRMPSAIPVIAGNPALKNLSVLELSPRANPVRRAIYEATFKNYVASDNDNRLHKGDITLDLCNTAQIEALGRSFDVVFFAHVLEHIPDYKLALRNLKKLISPDGIAVLQIPLQEARYTEVTWDEFHGDQTRVFHRFGFDILTDLEDIFSRVDVYVGRLDCMVENPEINTDKYKWITKRASVNLREAGEDAIRFFGFGTVEYCDAFILKP